jgi:glycosyltransferase involved in cell wall biosynthesis
VSSSAGAAAEWRQSPEPPSVSTIICTRERPELLARAVRAVFAQDYPGHLECVVVFDQSEPAPLDVTVPHNGQLRIITNGGTPGLAGARNAGIAHASGTLVAFCDDDDEWQPSKLRRQVETFRAMPDAVLAATGIRIVTEDDTFERVAPPVVTHVDLLRSRITAIHPSTFLFARADLQGRIGLVDEGVPFSYGEDYEMLLRATRHGTVCAVPDALVNIYWNRPSFFAARWEGIASGLTYILDRFPEFATERTGRARVRGQVAFARAALGERRAAARWAMRTLRDDPRELRAYAALAVALRLAPARRLVEWVQARGKGL